MVAYKPDMQLSPSVLDPRGYVLVFSRIDPSPAAPNLVAHIWPRHMVLLYKIRSIARRDTLTTVIKYCVNWYNVHRSRSSNNSDPKKSIDLVDL
jgi:hypothetical protein